MTAAHGGAGRPRGRLRIRAIRGGKWFRERGQKGISLLPHLFTLTNLAAGFYSLVMSAQQNYQAAALLVGISLLADGLDGRVARLVRADGEFGKELDSLADVVAFGAAPALLAYQVGLHRLGPYGLAVAALFPICGALRLARFNLIHTSGFFLGLPITAAGSLLAALIYRYGEAGLGESPLLPAVMVALGFLMISTIPYPDFKKVRRGRATRGRLVEWGVPASLALWSLVRDPQSIVVVPLVTYALLGPYLLVLRKAGESVARLRAASER
ncbi:MAG: CDP-diacylglycerol--serine O-phosphatidyltransferase [Bacillota bacterium]|nr:MAG: CDP-diacylglycerol--serine O-phosphatidyltransferase [Bacillota bacterium]